MLHTSEAGLSQLVAEEGEVLHAYRDVAGIWTIGVGLTAASGVVVPKAGMAVDRDTSRRLLGDALARSYEPAVAAALPDAAQAAFDGAVSFHFNTGAIGRASWVGVYCGGDRDGTRRGLLVWDRAGGKALAALALRRGREADLILDGRYAAAPTDAVLQLGSRGDAVAALQGQLIRLNLLAPPADGTFGASTEAAVKAFQHAHPDLVVDGVAGPATRAQMRRVLDARNRAVVVAGAAAGGVAAIPAGLPWPIVFLLAGAALLALGLLLLHHRSELRALLSLKRA